MTTTHTSGLFGFPMSDADRFRKKAEECREQAERAINPLDKEAWLRVAGEWLKLAAADDARREK
jgi:hypothetical protein